MVDGISSTSTTAMAVNRSIVQSVRAVAQARGLLVSENGGRRFTEPEPLW